MRLSVILSLVCAPALMYGQPLVAVISSGATGTNFNGYSHQRSITISSSETSATQASFPQLVCANITLGNTNTCPTVSGLNQSGGGARVINMTTFNSQTVPADLVFTTDSTCMTLMKWDTASYTASTGAFEARVLITSLSSSSNTVFYMCYGKSAVTTYQGGTVGQAYDANTCAVYHVANGTTLSLKDSSAGGANLTAGSGGGITAVAGQIDGGAQNVQSVSTQGYATGTTSCTMTGNPLTLEGWAKLTANSSSFSPIVSVGSTSVTAYLGPTGSSVTGNSNFSYASGTAAASAPTNVWVHLAGVSPGGSSGTNTLYANGTSIATASFATSFTGTSTVAIFGFPNSTQSSIAGIIDEIVVSNTNRAASWIAAEYNMESAPSTYITFGTEL